jgi:type I restriction enzyme M protein
VSTRATIGRIGINRIPIATNQGFKNVVVQDPTQIVPEFLALAITKLVPTMETWATGGTFKEISKAKFSELQIPLPPLALQKEIVAEIEGFQRIIDGAKAVTENYKPRIPIHPDWPLQPLADLTDLITKGTTPTSIGYEFSSKGVNFLKIEAISNSGALIPSKFSFIDSATHEALRRSQLCEGDVLFSIAGALGRSAVIPQSVLPANLNQALAIIRLKPKIADPTYISLFLRSDTILDHIEGAKAGVAQYNLSLRQVGELKIPLPPLRTQRQIVADIEAEQSLVAANRDLVERFTNKIQATIARVWGEALPAMMET